MNRIIATQNNTQQGEFTFHFVVKASTWDEVIDLFSNELGITKKRNSSDREINGLYLVSSDLESSKLTKSFYEKISNSNNIAVHSDEKSSQLYPLILKETQMVEEKLRWLLLHVSDAIEDYAKLLGYEKNDIVEQDKLDPLTSRLTFEGILGLFELDQSWARDGVDDVRMRQLIDKSSDFESFKRAYIDKTAPKTIWESISEQVLQRPVKWDAISPKLKSIKALRNKCAHFHTISEDDLHQARALRKNIIHSLSKKQITSSNEQSLMALSKQIAETMKRLTDSLAPTQNALQSLTTGLRLSNPSTIRLDESLANIQKSLIESFDTHSAFTDDPAQKIINEKLKSVYQKRIELIEDRQRKHKNILNKQKGGNKNAPNKSDEGISQNNKSGDKK